MFHPSYHTTRSQSLLCVPASVKGGVEGDPTWLADTLAKAKGAKRLCCVGEEEEKDEEEKDNKKKMR